MLKLFSTTSLRPPPVSAPCWYTLLYLHIPHRPTLGAQLIGPLFIQGEEISLLS